MTEESVPAKELPPEELYGDLFTPSGDAGDALLRAELEHLRMQTSSQASQLAEMAARLEELTQEVETLRNDKSVLCTNISCLYKTALLEIGRKDAEIQQLRTSAASRLMR